MGFSDNPRLTAKDRALIKGALRRVFSRSDLRAAVVLGSIVQHADPSRPRVKKWSKCLICEQFIPKYLMEVDHKEPVQPLDKTLDMMNADDLIDRIWTTLANLQCICKPCHKLKTKAEMKLRPKRSRKVKV